MLSHHLLHNDDDIECGDGAVGEDLYEHQLQPEHVHQQVEGVLHRKQGHCAKAVQCTVLHRANLARLLFSSVIRSYNFHNPKYGGSQI